MLKRILINRRSVPVPVPIKNLQQALHWVQQTLVLGDQVITKIMLDGREIDETADDIRFDSSSRLELFIESPIDLSVQTLETARNLASVLCRSLKPLAVACWEASPKAPPQECESVLVDLRLVVDLLDHFQALISPKDCQSLELASLGQAIVQSLTGLQMARSQSDWRGFARVLLNRLEPELDKFCSESASIQADLLSYKSSRRADLGENKIR